MLNDIQKILEAHKQFTKERDWDQFQNPKNLSMALSVEAAELAEIFIWLSDSQSIMLSDKQINHAAEEIADVLMYLLRISDALGINPIKAALDKMEKNKLKYSVEKGKELAKALVDNSF